MSEAVERAFGAASPGDTVLLAPACSSFDMFADYARARGRRLQGGEGPGRRLAAMAKKLSRDTTLFALTVALLGLGLVMVWSASSALAQELHGDAYHFLIRQVVWACFGLVVMIAAMRLDYRKLRQPAVVYSTLGVTTLFLIVVLFLRPVNDTHRWIRLGSLSLPAGGAREGGRSSSISPTTSRGAETGSTSS